MINFENLDKIRFWGVGKYNIPAIRSVTGNPLGGEFIPVNFAKTEKSPQDKSLHFFVDDYQFIRYWNSPDIYIPKLQQFRAVCAPDFSTYIEMPRAMQIYNHYRKHWLAAYWQMHGITVYPTISWSTPDSYDWCFDGEPVNGNVYALSDGLPLWVNLLMAVIDLMDDTFTAEKEKGDPRLAKYREKYKQKKGGN